MLIDCSPAVAVVNRALQSAQSFFADYDTMWPTLWESDSCHSGTFGEFEIFKMAAKMAAMNIKINKYAISSLLTYLETYFLGLGIGFGTQVLW